MPSTSRSRIGRCGRRGGQHTTEGKEEELEAPTTTITRGGAHPQVLGRTVALTTSTTITSQNCLRILKNLPEQYQAHPLSRMTHTKANVCDMFRNSLRLGLAQNLVKGYLALWGSPAIISNSLIRYSSSMHQISTN